MARGMVWVDTGRAGGVGKTKIGTSKTKITGQSSRTNKIIKIIIPTLIKISDDRTKIGSDITTVLKHTCQLFKHFQNKTPKKFKTNPTPCSGNKPKFLEHRVRHNAGKFMHVIVFGSQFY